MRIRAFGSRFVGLSLTAALASPLGVMAQSPGLSPTAPGLSPASASACAPVVDPGVISDWARAGFTDPEPVANHSVGVAGEIAGILFGYPFTAPPRPDTNNKILWVARYVDGSDLVISAQRMDGADPVGWPVERIVPGGPGPSVIDMPEVGCWRLTLSWAGRTDRIDLDYGLLVPDPSASPS